MERAPLRGMAGPRRAGATVLVGLVRRELAAIGVTGQGVAMKESADLRLIDEVAPYDSALWYLGRVGCVRKIHCSALADAALQAASLASSAEERMARAAEAEALMPKAS